MRWLSLLTQSITILIAQQLISTWFLFDFFVTRDSLTASNLWKKSKSIDDDSMSKTLSLAETIYEKKCQIDPINYEATFDKLIFIVIDALGSSFIPIIDKKSSSSSGTDISQEDQDQNQHVDTMPFVMESLRQKTAMGVVAKAATPTVTMPRIKALLSGTIPSFVDIVYNLASDVSKFDDDNIIRVAKNLNKTLVFYGDDTWLSLFKRNIFARVKETHSFFANDYTTVDTNVTERALPETSADIIDWDFLLLHYLGLDHIGHVFGTNANSLIDAKLGEMDAVIKQIYDNMAKKARQHKTLVVICGDHGMSKGGNHGGASDLEANTAILFLPVHNNSNQTISFPMKISHPHVKQVDLAVTLSLVLGMNIPTMSKGVAIEPFLTSLWPEKSKLACAFLKNLIQIGKLVDTDQFEELSKETNLEINLKNQLNSSGNLEEIARNYHSVARKIQKILLDTIASRSYPYLLVTLLVLVSILSILNLRRTSLRLLLPTISRLDQLFCSLVVILPILMLGSTNFIENEHKFWPLYSIISFVFLCCMVRKNQLTKSIFSIDPIRGVLFIVTTTITTLRIFTPSFEQEMTSNSVYALSIAAVIMFCNFIRQNSDVRGQYKGLLAMLIGFTIIFTKHIEESRATSDLTEDIANCALIQRLATLGVVIFCAIEIVATKESLHLKVSEGIGPVALVIRKLASSWICVAFLLSRRRDFVFLISNVMMETSLNSICKSLQVPLIVRTIIYYNFSQASFFNQGNSNSFSSIDVMPAFFAQTTYDIYLSIPLVAIATYSMQIYWLMKLFQRIQDDRTASTMSLSGSLSTRTFLGSSKSAKTTTTTTSIVTSDSAETSVKLIRDLVIMRNFLSQSYYMFVCMWLRNHLFIWSVLSPKLIYHFVTNGIILTVVIVISSLSNLQRLFGHDDDDHDVKTKSKLSTTIL